MKSRLLICAIASIVAFAIVAVVINNNSEKAVADVAVEASTEADSSAPSVGVDWASSPEDAVVTEEPIEPTSKPTPEPVEQPVAKPVDSGKKYETSVVYRKWTTDQGTPFRADKELGDVRVCPDILWLENGVKIVHPMMENWRERVKQEGKITAIVDVCFIEPGDTITYNGVYIKEIRYKK